MKQQMKYCLAIKDKFNKFSIEKAHFVLTFLLPRIFKDEFDSPVEANMQIQSIKSISAAAIRKSKNMGSLYSHWDHLGRIYHIHKNELVNLIVIEIIYKEYKS